MNLTNCLEKNIDFKKLLHKYKLKSAPPNKLEIDEYNIQKFNQKPENLLEKTILISAPPNSGKTVLIRSLLSQINESTAHTLFILLSPTNTLDSVFLPNICWVKVDDNLHLVLHKIVERQTKRADLYKKGNEIDVLTKMIYKCAPSFVSQVNMGLVQFAGEPSHLYEEKIVKYLQASLQTILKTNTTKFTDDERRMIALFGKKPRLVLIFDDLANAMTHCNSLTRLSTNYRHIYTTLFIIAHSFSNVNPQVRKCASTLIAKQASVFMDLHNKDSLCDNPTIEFLQNYAYLLTNHKTYHLFLSISPAISVKGPQVQFIAAEHIPQKPLLVVPPALEKKIQEGGLLQPLEKVNLLFTLHNTILGIR